MQKMDSKLILLIIVALILTAISIGIYSNKILRPTINNNKIKAQYEEEKRQADIDYEEDEKAENLTDEQKLLELRSESELDRMHYYLSEYLQAIDSKDYNKAYSYLYQEFKDNYFPTEEKFEEYAKQNYPEFMGVQYEDVNRIGKYYTFEIFIYDITKDTIENRTVRRYVINEDEIGKFELSFEM